MIDVKKFARPCILVRKEYVPGKPVEEVQREFGITDIIKLASNENPLGCSPLAVEAMVKELTVNTNYYPESLAPALIAKLAKRHNLTPANFYIDNGEDGVITMLGLTFINPGDEVVMSELTFPAYENIVGKMDGVSFMVPQTKVYRHDIKGMLAKIGPKTKMVFVCNPNNPTGTYTTKKEFEQLLKGVPKDVLIVSDEAYYEFATAEDYPQSLDYLAKYPNLIVLRTFSKVYGLAGQRVGYLMADADLVKVMMKAREPFPVNRAGQAGAMAAMDDKKFVKDTIKLNTAGQKQLSEGLTKLGFKVLPTQTNFIFAEFTRETKPIFDGLLREGVIIRPLAPQGAPNCIRVTIGTKAQNKRFLDSLKKVLGN
ncbi:MAG TPA: histidinol-phosphate transaminase [Bellilinea sp.]|nr:histidinol-phosphate transaminase [Bellilinea sp.]